ncbi:MAG: efflux RND transporter periplasmic adaptor subunit [Paludibacteraceae bacterium]|nr:efflux RND transporter periplasmic adaptor subunit [Paludibacteraceae bacterium]
MIMRKGIYILLVLVLCGCSKIVHKPKVPSAVHVETVVVAPQLSHAQSRYVGEVCAVRETPLSMQSAGRVLEIGCRDGERVRKGQVLVRIDSTQSVNALRSAEASLRHAQDGYDRAKQVHTKGGVTDQQMVEIESQLTQAESMYAAAKRRVEECTLRSPFDGVVSGLKLSIGETVTPGIQLFSILDISSLSVRFSVPEGEIGGVESNSGTVEVPAAGVELPIRITEKSVRANTLTHAYSVTAAIKGGVGVLMPGMVGKVRLETSSQTEHGPASPDRIQTIVIPAHCVLLMPKGPTVWVVENGKAVRRAIEVSGYQANGVQVSSGLEVGDTLVVEGYQKLYTGCEVVCGL